LGGGQCGELRRRQRLFGSRQCRDELGGQDDDLLLDKAAS
jgi:hypothetical protein